MIVTGTLTWLHWSQLIERGAVWEAEMQLGFTVPRRSDTTCGLRSAGQFPGACFVIFAHIRAKMVP